MYIQIAQFSMHFVLLERSFCFILRTCSSTTINCQKKNRKKLPHLQLEDCIFSRLDNNISLTSPGLTSCWAQCNTSCCSSRYTPPLWWGCRLWHRRSSTGCQPCECTAGQGFSQYLERKMSGYLHTWTDWIEFLFKIFVFIDSFLNI